MAVEIIMEAKVARSSEGDIRKQKNADSSADPEDGGAFRISEVCSRWKEVFEIVTPERRKGK